MSDNEVTVKKGEAELFKIVQRVDAGAARVEAARLLLTRLDHRSPVTPIDA